VGKVSGGNSSESATRGWVSDGNSGGLVRGEKGVKLVTWPNCVREGKVSQLVFEVKVSHLVLEGNVDQVRKVNAGRPLDIALSHGSRSGALGLQSLSWTVPFTSFFLMFICVSSHSLVYKKEKFILIFTVARMERW
jgi:hypothetical protein